MKTFLTVITAVLLTPGLGLAQRLDDIDLSALFIAEYDNPIAEAYGTEVPSLLYCGVYDEEQQAEDPLFADCWFVTDSSQIHPCTVEGLQDALTALSYVPGSNEDALTIVRLLVSKVLGGRIVSDPSDATWYGVPAEVATSVTAPEVTLSGDLFTVTFFTGWYDLQQLEFDQDARVNLRYYTVDIGPDLLTIRATEQIWSGTLAP